MKELIWSEKGCLPQQAREIRENVFVKEQGFCEEFDTQDGDSWHLLLLEDGKAIGTSRIFWGEGDRLHIGRVAVLKENRGGAGRLLIEACVTKARELGAKAVELGAQKRAAAFYEKCGFTSFGAPYLDEGCPHIMMEKQL